MKVGKINSKFVSTDIRFSAGYFLNDDAVNSRVIERNYANCIELGNLATVWNPPIFKRQFCENTERAVPYCQSSDVTNALEGSEVFINKVQAYKVGSIVEDKQILVTGFGTIGNTRLVNELSNGISYANNVCRIKVKDFIPYGYVYAFMTSKYGKSQLNKNASGSVVRYIEAPGIKKTLIPILPGETQQKIHNLIVESAQLRVEANKLLKEAVEIFDEFKIEYSAGSYVFNKVKIQKISSNKKRFDANYNVISELVDEKLKNIKYVTIRSQSSKIFIGPRSKRNYVATGVPFLSTSEMQKANPTKTEKFVNHKTAKDFAVREGWILTTRSGTLGDTIFVMPVIDNYAVSEDGIRIVVDENSEISNRYLFAFLKSNIGKNSLLAGSYGSVILHLNEDYVGDIKVPVFEEKFEEIERNVSKYIECFNQAIINENQAIDLIEKEIDQWQQ